MLDYMAGGHTILALRARKVLNTVEKACKEFSLVSINEQSYLAMQ